jgi:hypothetical protein
MFFLLVGLAWMGWNRTGSLVYDWHAFCERLSAN